MTALRRIGLLWLAAGTGAACSSAATGPAEDEPAGLEVPTGFAVASRTSTSITLTWEAVTGADLYRLELRPGGSGEFEEATTTPATSSTVEGLEPATSYDFRLFSQRVDGSHSEYSPVLTAATQVGG